MRKIPMHPVIRLKLAQILNEHYGMPGVKSVLVATAIINHLRDADMDIVKGDWMAGEVDKTSFRWEDLAGFAQEMEDTGRAPWNAPELR